MQKLKKLLRFACLLFLIILACVGFGIFGGAPVPVIRKKEDTIEIKNEFKETDKSKTEAVLFDKIN